MDSVQDKVAVITGAGSGMGRAVALRLARAGAKVVVADIDEGAAGSVAAEIETAGGESLAVAIDVADAAANDRLLDATVDRFERCNIVFLNAGVTGSAGRSWQLSEEDWNWTLGINLDGVVNGIRSFVPHLIELGDGHVVATASIAGHTSGPYCAPYSISKHAVAALMETLHHELRLEQADVGVTCLCPGFVNTNIVSSSLARPDGEVGTARDDRGEKWIAMSDRALQTGLDPAVVGEQVLDAILTNQFWRFTDEAWDQPIQERVDAIIAREPPPIGTPSDRG